MTSNHCFFKLQRELIKRNLVLPVLSGIGFFFSLPFITIIYLQNQFSRDVPQERVSGILTESINSVLVDGIAIFSKIGLVIMATLAGIILFRYLHSRKQVDFFHSLPISRNSLFAQLYLTGFMSVIPLYVIMYAVSVVIACVMGCGEYISAGLLLLTVVKNIIFFLFFYSLSVLATILSGNTFITVALYVFFNFFIVATALIFDTLCSLSFETYWTGQMLRSMFDYSCPFAVFLSGNLSPFGFISYNNTYIIFIAIATVALILLNSVLFRVRKSESAGSALSFKCLKTPLKCYLALMSGYIFMIILNSMVNYNISNIKTMVVGITIGVVLCHIFFEILYNFDIRSAFKCYKTMIVLVVAGIGLFSFMKADVFGYDYKIPNEQDIKGVSISARYPNSVSEHNFISTISPFTDSKNISNVITMAEIAVDGLKQQKENGGRLEESQDYGNLTVNYILKNGRTMTRDYNSVPETDEYLSSLKDIYLSQEYRKNEARSVFDIDYNKNITDLKLEIRTNADLPSDISGSIVDIQKSKEIIDAIREESLKLTQAQMENEIPVLRIDADVSYKEKTNSSYETRYSGRVITYIPVYSTYTKTLALIEKYSNVKPQAMTADDIANIQITKYIKSQPSETGEISEFNINSVTITDKNEIAEILENGMTSEVSNSLSAVYSIDSVRDFDIILNTASGASTGIVYKDGKTPYNLFNSYFTN